MRVVTILGVLALVPVAGLLILFCIGCVVGKSDSKQVAAGTEKVAAGPPADAPIADVPLPVVAPDVNGLQSPDRDTRQKAASQMGETGDVKDGDALLAALGSEADWTVRASITRGLGKQYLQSEAFRAKGADRLLKPLLPLLGAEQPGLRLEAVRALNWIGDRRATKALFPLLEDADSHIQQLTIETLGKMGDAGLLTRFVHLVQTAQDEWTRYSAVSALRQMHDRSAVAPLIAALDSETKPSPRRAMAIALGALGDTQAVPVLMAHLKDADPDVRYWCAKALAQLKDKRALPALEIMARADSGSGNGKHLDETARNAMRVIRNGGGKVDEYD